MRFKDSWIFGPLSFDTTPLLGGETSPRLGAPGPFGVETWGGECNGWNGLKSWVGCSLQKACRDSRWWFHMFRRHIFNIAILDRLNPLSCMIRIYFTSYRYVSYLSPGLNRNRELRLQSFTTLHFELPGHGTQLREDVQVPPVLNFEPETFEDAGEVFNWPWVLPLPMFFPYILYILLNHGRLSGLLGLIFLEVLKFMFCVCQVAEFLEKHRSVEEVSVPSRGIAGWHTHGWHTIKQAAHVDGLPIL